MRIINFVVIILCIIFLGSVVLANDPNWNGDVKPEIPSVTVTNPNGEGRDSFSSYQRQYFDECTCDTLTVKRGLESLKFRHKWALKQCNVLRQEMECPQQSPSL